MNTKWASDAANRFKIPSKEGLYPDVEQLFKALVALQLRAYRRGVKGGYLEGDILMKPIRWLKRI